MEAEVSVDFPKELWMEIDLKNKELPLKVADTAEDLAEACGVTVSTIRSSACRARKGRRVRYVAVWIGG